MGKSLRYMIKEKFMHRFRKELNPISKVQRAFATRFLDNKVKLLGINIGLPERLVTLIIHFNGDTMTITPSAT